MPESRTAARRAPVLLLAALLAPAAPAFAEPALPQLPADGAVVDIPRPTFSWTAGSSGLPIARYEVVVETPAGNLEVAEAPAGALTAVSTVDLPDDTGHRWFVRLVNAAGGVAATPVAQRATVMVATPPGAPSIAEGPAGPTPAAAPVFAWAGGRASSRWVVSDAAGTPLQSGEAPSGDGRAALAPLPDGAYVFAVAQRNAAGAESPAASREFTVDATAPGAPSPSLEGPGGQERATTPAFSWRADPGTTATWRVRGAGGRIVAGPSGTPQARIAPDPLPPGAYVFEVRLADAVGNLGPWGSEPFTIVRATAAGAAAVSGRTRLNLLRRNARRLSPGPGAVIAGTRPVLRWRGGPAGARVYNLQLFRLGAGGRLVKIGSAFPGGRRYALPPGTTLTRGDCFVWRVWPNRGGRYTPQPLGVSDFCVARTG
jgi:hypothetical protein